MNSRKLMCTVLVGPPFGRIHGFCRRPSTLGGAQILVLESLSTDYYTEIVGSAAVVCGEGARTGHMQSVCRARGIPVVRIDPSDLEDVAGTVTIDLRAETITIGTSPAADDAWWQTRTSLREIAPVCAVITNVEDIRRLNDGVQGEYVDTFFIREEFLCFELGLSPFDFLDEGPQGARNYGKQVGECLSLLLRASKQHQRVVFRLLDLRSDDAVHLARTRSVATEPNPELGFHGARWLICSTHYPIAFQQVVRSIEMADPAHVAQVGWAIPFVNDANELAQVRHHVRLLENVPVGAFIETPAAVFSAPEICEAGAGEIFVGTKDLVQFYLAADRGNSAVSHVYDTRHPVVLDALRSIVSSADRSRTPVHLYSLAADLDFYRAKLPPPTSYMLCSAEILQLRVSD